MGADFQHLNLYFSAVLCVQLANTKTACVRESDGVPVSGRQVFEGQVDKLREVLRALINSRRIEREGSAGLVAAGSVGGSSVGCGPGRRLITSRQGLWFSL